MLVTAAVTAFFLTLLFRAHLSALSGCKDTENTRSLQGKRLGEANPNIITH
jgi:hypothetical protein